MELYLNRLNTLLISNLLKYKLLMSHMPTEMHLVIISILLNFKMDPMLSLPTTTPQMLAEYTSDSH